jgi:hypothetical protein
MKATIMAKLHTSIDKKDLSLILRSAWLSVLYQVPNVTIQPNLIGEKVYTIKYNQATPSQQEAETWLDQTISEEFAKDVQDPLNYLDEQSTAIGQHKLPSNRMSNASLLVYYFLDKSDQVNRLAIICHANHAAFDGSGVYNCLNRLLLDTVTGINLPTKKAAPEEHFNAYLSPDIMQADHSKLTKDILNSYMLPLVSRASFLCARTSSLHIFLLLHISEPTTSVEGIQHKMYHINLAKFVKFFLSKRLLI